MGLGYQNPTWLLSGRPQTSARFAFGFHEFGCVDKSTDVRWKAPEGTKYSNGAIRTVIDVYRLFDA